MVDRQVEANELVVLLDELERLNPRTHLVGDAVQLVVEDVAEALGEDKREDEFLELRGILRTANRAGGVPNPGFERFVSHAHGARPVVAAAIIGGADMIASL